MIESIQVDGKQVAIVVRSGFKPHQTTFISAPTDNLQLGFIVYAEGKSIAPHIHKNVERRISGTPEVLYVKTGKTRAVFYAHNREKRADVILEQGDVIVLLDGGHGFDMLADTVLMEIKQGPYLGENDKERF